MTLAISTPHRVNTNSKTIVKRTNVSNLRSDRQQIAQLLFGKSLGNVSFAGNQQLSKVEQQIIDIFTDPGLKSAIVTSHTRPDIDAYATTVGVTELLTDRGVKVFPFNADTHMAVANNMPTMKKGVNAAQLIQKPGSVSQGLADLSIDKADIAVITDSARPDMITTKPVKIIAKNAKRVIIIDHHGDLPGGKTNLELWQEKFAEFGLEKEQIIYWREKRGSASEMVAELDQAVQKQTNLPFYAGHRLLLAAGIADDVGCIFPQKGEPDEIKFSRPSEKSVIDQQGKEVSITRAMYDWLIATSGVSKKNIDIKSIARLALPEELDKMVDGLIDGTVQVDGIEVKTATKEDPFAYLYIKDSTEIQNLATKSGVKIKDLNDDILKRLEDKINEDVHVGVMAFIKDIGQDEEKSFSMNIRSYGYESLDGETYIPGHVFCNALAKNIITTLKLEIGGRGGGHANACGFNSLPCICFKEDALPIITEMVNDLVDSSDLTLIPESLQFKQQENKPSFRMIA